MEKIIKLNQPAQKKTRRGFSLERREKQVGLLFALPSTKIKLFIPDKTGDIG